MPYCGDSLAGPAPRLRILICSGCVIDQVVKEFKATHHGVDRSLFISADVDSTKHLNIVTVGRLGEVPGTDDHADTIGPAHNCNLRVLNAAGSANGQDVPPHALLFARMLAVDESNDSGGGQFLLALDQIRDTVTLRWMGVQIEKPSQALRFEERGIESECRGDTYARLSSAFRRLP
jgi:hypothetical protein